MVFQCDADDSISGLLIRPLQELSQRLRGRPSRRSAHRVPLANHAGIRVLVAGPDGKVRRYVVEQLNATLQQNVSNALSWTPWQEFRAREGGGWDVTVPADSFEGVEAADVLAAVDTLNGESGLPFYQEVCTTFVERILGGRVLFEQVELLDRLVPGPGPRIPEPAAPRFKADARLSRRARHLLRVDDISATHGRVVRKINQKRLGAVRLWYWLLAQAVRWWSSRPVLRDR